MPIMQVHACTLQVHVCITCTFKRSIGLICIIELNNYRLHSSHTLPIHLKVRLGRTLGTAHLMKILKKIVSSTNTKGGKHPSVVPAYVQSFVGHRLATKVFCRQISSYQRGVSDHRVGQWWERVMYLQTSGKTSNGAHEMHGCIHPN